MTGMEKALRYQQFQYYKHIKKERKRLRNAPPPEPLTAAERVALRCPSIVAGRLREKGVTLYSDEWRNDK